MTDQTFISEGNSPMKRYKVSLGTSNRPIRHPYVRKKIGNGKADVVDRPSMDQSQGYYPQRGKIISQEVPQLAEKISSDEVEVLAHFRKLDQKTQRAVLAKMSLEIQKGPSDEEARDVDLWSVSVTAALRDALGPSDGAGHGPQVVRRLMGASSAWTPMAEFIANGRIGNLRPAERLAVFDMLAKLLVDRAKRVASRADIPLSAKLVAQNAVHIAGIFDNAFPGYLANGLVGAVSRMLIAKPTGVAMPTPRVRLN